MTQTRAATILTALFGAVLATQAEDLFRMRPDLEPRWASPENPQGR